MKLPRPATALVFTLLAAVSCRSRDRYSGEDSYYYTGQPERIIEAYGEARDDPGIDGLLGMMKLLSAYLSLGDWKAAEDLALDVSTGVNIYRAGESGERDALSAFGSERDKPFKGESHEQAMADFYLGLLRLRKGDPEGALCCFRSALDKDRGSYVLPVESKEARAEQDNTMRYLYAADYATFELFAARCWRALGEMKEARRSLARAKKLRPDLGALLDAAMDLEKSALVVIEAGGAPEKLQNGPRGSILRYEQGPEVVVEEVRLNDESLMFAETDDLHEQATTLGKRQVDELNQVKARRQEALQAVGMVATIAGAAIASSASRDDDHGKKRKNRSQRNAGLVTMAAGLATVIFSEVAFDPGADTRTWTLLPGTLLVAVAPAPVEPENILEIRWRRGSVRYAERRENVSFGEGGDLAWIRLLPARAGRIPPGLPANDSRSTRAEEKGHYQK